MSTQIQRTTKKLSWFVFFLLSFAVAGASKLPFASKSEGSGTLARMGDTAEALFGAQSAHADFVAGSVEGPVLGMGCSGCGAGSCDTGSSGSSNSSSESSDSSDSGSGAGGSAGGGCGGCGGPAAHREFLS